MDETAEAELYLKPDDQNEVNDVADRRADVTEAGRACLQAILDNPEAAVELPDVLLDEPD